MTHRLIETDFSETDRLPLDHWHREMEEAIARIRAVGLELLEVHSGATPRAAEVASGWELSGKIRQEHDALGRLFESLHRILESLDTVPGSMTPAAMDAASVAVDRYLPGIEEDFLLIRHAALDLLRWSMRDGRLDDSGLPDQYRAAYGDFIAYAPMFNTWLSRLQELLLEQLRESNAGPAAQRLLSAVTRYMGVIVSARGFAQAIVDPPMELVFHETNLFLDDWSEWSVEARAAAGTELNDCCQCLLYDVPGFLARVRAVEADLPVGLDSSMYMLTRDNRHVLFSVDEDPLFSQIIITLYRAVSHERLEEAIRSLIEILYKGYK